MEIAQKARRTNMKRARQEALAPRKTKAKEMQLAKRLGEACKSITRGANKGLIQITQNLVLNNFREW